MKDFKRGRLAKLLIFSYLKCGTNFRPVAQKVARSMAISLGRVTV
jgi:hypothetical protein